MSPGRVRGMGLVPEPKQGREKQRKHKSEPAEGLCKANPGLAAASTGGIWVLPRGWGTRMKAGGTSWAPEPRLSPLLRPSGVERRRQSPGGWAKGSQCDTCRLSSTINPSPSCTEFEHGLGFPGAPMSFSIPRALHCHCEHPPRSPRAPFTHPKYPLLLL